MSQTADASRPSAVPRCLRIDVIGGATVVFIAMLIWFGAMELEIGQLARIGSGAMPKALALLLFAAGCAVMAKGLLRDDDAERLELAFRPAAIIVMAMLLFAFFIRGGNFGIVTTPQLGLTVVGPVTVFVAGCAASNVRPGELLVTAFALTAALLLVFADLLGLGIPIFPRFLEDAIPRSIGSIGATRVVYIAYGASAAALYVLIFGRGGKGRG